MGNLLQGASVLPCRGICVYCGAYRITLGGAKKYIQNVLLKKGAGKVEGFPKISLQKAVEMLVDKAGEGEVVYRGRLFTRKKAAAFMAQGRGINMKNAKEYIHGVLRGGHSSAQ